MTPADYQKLPVKEQEKLMLKFKKALKKFEKEHPDGFTGQQLLDFKIEFLKEQENS